MRRNDIVLVGKPDMFNFYGRVNRMIDADHAEVICCGKYCRVYPLDELTLSNDYKGFASFSSGAFIRMATLRKLKQMASRYNPEVWKRKRKTATASQAIEERLAKWDAMHPSDSKETIE